MDENLNQWRSAAKPVRVFGITWYWLILLFLFPMFLGSFFSYLIFVVVVLSVDFILNKKSITVGYLINRTLFKLRGGRLTGRPFWINKN